MKPVSKATINAAHLGSRPIPPVPTNETAIEEMAVGVSPSREQMIAWVRQLHATKGISGDQLLGFRQSDDGMVYALVQKSN